MTLVLQGMPCLVLALAAGIDGRASGELFTRVADGEVRAVLSITIEPGWHLYHTEQGHPESIGELLAMKWGGEGIEWQAPRLPEPERHAVVWPEGAWAWVHYGRITVYARGRLADGATGEDASVVLTGQTCSDEDGTCVQYRESLESLGPGSDALFADFPLVDGASARGPPESATAGAAGREGLLAFLLLAVFWGVFTLLMPCTYPMIPITISFFTKQAIAREGRVLSLSLAYGAGIVLIFVLIGVLVGPPIVAFATHPVTNLVIGSLFVYFALVLFGVVDLQPPQFLMRFAGKASARGGFAGVFLMGATLVVTSFTCTAPFVGSLLAVGAERSLGDVVLGMGTFGLTMATPFVLLSLLPGRLRQVPRAGEWMHVLKVFLGFVEVAAALKFFSNSDLVWGWGLLSREVFLVLWTGIFLCAAAFLFGWIRLVGEKEREIGPLRMLGGLATLLFALYCGLGVLGFVMDDVMTAIIPNYSSPRLASLHGDAPARVRHAIVVDDYEAARELARSSDKLLLVNFTGHT